MVFSTHVSALDDLPTVDSFFGVDLKTGSMIIAAICVVRVFLSISSNIRIYILPTYFRGFSAGLRYAVWRYVIIF